MQGYIKIHRKILNWGWYDDSNVMRVFVHLLLTANYEEKDWRGVTLHKGELITSLDRLAKSLKISVRQIRLVLHKLSSTGEITIKTTNKYTHITICKYAEFQTPDADEVKQMAFKWQSKDKQRATTQERKEVKKDKNIKTPVAPFTKPSVEEVRAYCFERGNLVDAEAFVAFYESKGWKIGSTSMKNWRMAVITWEKRGGGSDGRFMTSDQRKRENTISALQGFMQDNNIKELHNA